MLIFHRHFLTTPREVNRCELMRTSGAEGNLLCFATRENSFRYNACRDPRACAVPKAMALISGQAT